MVQKYSDRPDCMPNVLCHLDFMPGFSGGHEKIYFIPLFFLWASMKGLKSAHVYAGVARA